ncbi:odorant-binding protein 59a [Stomoxys calcitrans]|uniref:odorant-binding protein 59a n=1 Tax=Stomoxys calcitrans TaxID=35570 RepID=UPI0027E3134F|nr:odorant-binding protein 59a [Stomoxys calcitrans]
MTQLAEKPAKRQRTFVCQIFFIALLLLLIGNSKSLRCRTDDGPSEAELKRVARSCMRKFGENAFNTQRNQQNNQQAQGRSNQKNNRNGYNNNYPDYGDSEESYEGNYDDGYRSQYYQRGYQENNRNGNNRGSNGNGRNGGSGGDYSGYNKDEDRYGNNDRNRQRSNNQNKSNGNNQWYQQNQRNDGGGGSSQNNRSGSNSNNNNNNNKNNNNYNNNNNRNKNNNSYGNNNNNNSNNNTNSDAACIAHCFFEELHMLNKNSYPDRHKAVYVLTKDMRDHELRNFYTDTIQECFRYLESQRRREKCLFSRDLISCMTEYAKGNCEDWNEFSTMFN